MIIYNIQNPATNCRGCRAVCPKSKLENVRHTKNHQTKIIPDFFFLGKKLFLQFLYLRSYIHNFYAYCFMGHNLIITTTSFLFLINLPIFPNFWVEKFIQNKLCKACWISCVYWFFERRWTTILVAKTILFKKGKLWWLYDSSLVFNNQASIR